MHLFFVGFLHFQFFFKNIRFLFGCNWQNIYICTALKKINTAFHFLFDSSAFCTVELTLCNVDNITVVYSRLPCLYCSIVCLRQTGLYFTLLSYPISFLSYVPLPHNNLRTHLINLSYMNKFTYLLLLLFCMMGGVAKAYAGIGDPLEKSGWSVTASSWCWDDRVDGNGKYDRIIDGDIQNFWHSNWGSQAGGEGDGGSLPQWFIVDIGSVQEIGGVIYTPRQQINNNTNGACKNYKVFVSENPFEVTDQASVNALTGEVASGSFEYTIAPKQVSFNNKQNAQYVMFVITDSYGSVPGRWATCAEFDVCSYVESASVTYNYTLDGVIKESKTITQNVGTEYNAPSLNVKYITFEQPKGKVTKGPNTVTVNCTVQGLPFEVSNSIDDKANWYKLFIQRPNAKTASYNPNNNRVNNYERVPYNTTCEWFAFQGNPFDGFKIYNYVAGNNKILWSASVENNALISFAILR